MNQTNDARAVMRSASSVPSLSVPALQSRIAAHERLSVVPAAMMARSPRAAVDSGRRAAVAAMPERWDIAGR